MLISELQGCDVAILGAGREGRSAYRWLRRQFPDQHITVYDEKNIDWPIEDGMRPVVGAFDPERLAAHDVLIRSPGVSPYRPAVADALRQDTRCTSATSLWFAAHPAARTLCITGTKGKSTTAALTARLIERAGLPVHLAGNIGTPLLDCADDPSAWWVIELSSYQIADLEARPTVAAILNISDEHLDWHGGAERYRRDKMRLADLARGAALVLNWCDPLLRSRFEGREGVRWFNQSAGWHVRDHQLWRGGNALSGLPREALAGDHNLLNLAAALTLLEAAGIDPPKLPEALQGFQGLPHRLQRLGVIGGVEYVNDSLSTTPVATLAALQAYAGRKVILLLGGLDRGLDWSGAIARMAETCPAAVIALPDNGEMVVARMSGQGLAPPRGIHVARNLDAGVRQAMALADTGDLVLLSPGAPSFPHFRDYAERGLQFARLAGFDIESL